MLKRMNLTLASVLAVVVQLFVAASASAHTPSVTATAVCTQNGPVIQYTATSWTAAAGGANQQVQILFNNVAVATNSFVPPSYSFTGSAAAPTGQQVTVTVLAVGAWDNGVAGGQSASVLVTVPSDCATGIGRFTGGGKQVRAGDLSVTRGLTIHCDLRLSNNLEVNWGSNHFHMTEHLTTVACSDDPNIVQAPPRAPLDTLVGVGTGRYNGVDGYTIRFILVDAGEPGALDKMAIHISETSTGNVVLNVPLQFLSGGNLQAHYDQPHKRN